MIPTVKPASIGPVPPRPNGVSGAVGYGAEPVASSVPVSNSESLNLPRPVMPVEKSEWFNVNHPRMQIYHPDLAPSAQSTEALLLARAMLQQTFAQNAAATRMALTSNPQRDAPRFSQAIDIMA